ncbi:MAG: MmgE/PrpD family protein [Deltaproteobacteria bacterium]|nr:MmgE/PrpD family protein [Deltaproteobacteria bacterium]
MAEDKANSADKLSQKLADFSVQFSLPSAPAKATDNAKLAILDCLGVAVLATNQEVGVNLLKFANANTSDGPCTIWGTSKSVTPRDAALINGTLAHGLDYDDRNHSTTYTLATSLAVCEQLNLSGAKMLAAFVVGREVRNSLDALFGRRSDGIGPGAKGWHSNGILGPIAAACSASHALSLSARETLAAIGLAAGSCGALTRDGGTMAKPFRTGHAAATGLTCALLAQSGFSSDDTAIEGRFGLLEALGPIPDDIVASLAQELGTKFHLENEIRIKPHASCTATHNGLEAMLRLVRQHDLKPEAIESIECDQKPYPLVRQIPQRGYEGRFSMAYCLAMALIHRELKPGDFTDANVEQPLVQQLMGRVRHTPGGPALVVQLKNGARLEEKLQTPSDLHGWDAVAEKFRAATAGSITTANAEIVIDKVKQLESVASIHALTGALRV